MAEAISLKETRFLMRNVETRMPFRYGAAALTSVPILHVGVTAELADSTPVHGWAADILPPKWFDKDPHKDYEENVSDLIAMARAAAQVFEDASRRPRSLFGIWRDGYAETLAAGARAGLNQLTSGHGSSLLERALIDAIGTARGVPYFDLLQQDALGIELADLHSGLKGISVRDVIAPNPAERIAVRHTVGLADPIRSADVDGGAALNDGLPQALEEYVSRQGLRYLKIKVNGDLAADLERLQQIAEVTGAISISLDGNEQYDNAEDLLELLSEMKSDTVLRPLFDRIIYIEQPLERNRALNSRMEAEIRRLGQMKAMVIDESDDDLDSFRQAAALGYTGVSAKNCKGLIKAIANKALAAKYSDETGLEFFMTGEDLMNLPVVPLHQDLAQLAALGVEHAERNGHHYVRGLDHLSHAERLDCLRAHATMYHQEDDLASLNISDGYLNVQSLQVPGLGIGTSVESGAMVPLDDWRFESLGSQSPAPE